MKKAELPKALALAKEARAAPVCRFYCKVWRKYAAGIITRTGSRYSRIDGHNGYYTKALNAAKEIINGSAGVYSLYNKKPDLGDNFASIFIDKKSGNPESIWVEDFKLKSGKVHGFTVS